MDALRPTRILALALTAVLAACTQSPDPAGQATASETVTQAIADHPMCERSVRLIVNPLVARPGATLKIFSDHPLGYAPPLDVPDELLTRWRASPAGAATFSPDGATVTVADSVAPGSALTLTALFCGQEEVTKTVPVVGRDEPVIVGFWRQESAECAAGMPRHDPVKELAFEANGDFSVTYFPFESYRDYWGTHVFDHRTGAIDMTVTGGNKTPVNPGLSGRARLESDKRLVLENVYLGPARFLGDGSCNYVFVK